MQDEKNLFGELPKKFRSKGLRKKKQLCSVNLTLKNLWSILAKKYQFLLEGRRNSIML